MTTEAIGEVYTAAEDPPCEGYQNAQLGGWDGINHYDYALAKRIVAYLRDQPAHPRLTYVAILGNGLLVPPSFYYYYRRYDAVNTPPYRFPEDHRLHEKWVPSDLFYASPDYDWVPNFRVGRLSVNDANEAAHVVDKVIRWHANADWSWFRNVQAGGLMGTDTAESEGLFEGMNLKRLRQGDDRADRVFLEPALNTRDTGIFWFCFDGSVSGVSFVGSWLGSDELLHYAPHIKVPVVILLTCYSGTFDLDLTQCSCIRGQHSFGEALLNSPAAGIACFGSSRAAHGGSVPSGPGRKPSAIDHMWTLLYGILQSRRQGADTLGQLYADTLFAFVSNANMAGNPCDVFDVFDFVFLGDPALKIPVRP